MGLYLLRSLFLTFESTSKLLLSHDRILPGLSRFVFNMEYWLLQLHLPVLSVLWHGEEQLIYCSFKIVIPASFEQLLFPYCVFSYSRLGSAVAGHESGSLCGLFCFVYSPYLYRSCYCSLCLLFC